VRVVSCPKRVGIDVGLIPRLVALIRRQRPLIVHTVLRTANYWGRVAACLAGVPIRVASERNIEVERGRLANALDAILASATDRVIVNAAAIRDHLVRTRGFDSRKITLIHNGVRVPERIGAVDRNGVRAELGVGSGERLVVTVARLVPQKNPGLFVEMARAVLDAGIRCRFVVVGDGPLRAGLAAKALALGLGDVVAFAGFRSDVPRVLAAADVFALTSDWEGLPNAVLEAMAAGVPVVTTDAGGVAEIVSDGVTGYIVPRGDAKGLADRVATLCGDEGRRRQLGDRAHEHVGRQFSIPAMVDRTGMLYDELLAKHGLPALSAA
jgi:glycosyltransferase involved in cell wall biosynthesis